MPFAWFRSPSSRLILATVATLLLPLPARGAPSVGDVPESVQVVAADPVFELAIQTTRLKMSTDIVKALLGKPSMILNTQGKQFLIYHNYEYTIITTKNGKVSEFCSTAPGIQPCPALHTLPSLNLSFGVPPGKRKPRRQADLKERRLPKKRAMNEVLAADVEVQP